MSKENTPSLDKNYVKELLQNVLNTNHTDVQKRGLKEFPDRYNFACPICGDSQKTTHKKRGNLYLSNMYYKCFNEPECSRSFTSFLNTFGIEMDLDKKVELYKYLDSNIKYNTIANEETSIELERLIPLDELVSFFQDDPSRKLTNMRPLLKGSAVDYYVRKERKILGDVDIYEATYHITPTWQQPVMVFLNLVKGSVIGMQTRNLLSGDKRVFKIYDFSLLYDMIHPDNDMDEQERISYNKISHFYNLFNTDLSRKVNIFEGYIDSLTVPNSIGLIGLNTDITFLINEDGVHLRFVYDNDKSGFKKSIQMLKEGQEVFLWNKFFIEISKKYKGEDSQKDAIINLSRKIKDFNKLSTYFKKELHIQFDLDNYFSSSLDDMLYLVPVDDVVNNGKLIYGKTEISNKLKEYMKSIGEKNPE